MRKIRRRKNQRQKKVIIISSICLLLCFCAGYAAFQTNISITAKGNIIESTYTIEELKDNFCNTESGDGLYADTYEEGRCVYKGSDPDNYIEFNNELWRIIAIETDGTLKIVNLDSTLEKEYNTYSCSDYANNELNGDRDAVSFFNYDCEDDTLIIPWDGKNMYSYFGGTYNPLPDAPVPTLNTYLNTEYLNYIDSDYRSYIVSHDFYIGRVGISTAPISDLISNEKSSVWNGYIALPNVSDFIRASTSSECMSGPTCGEENYFAKENGTVREAYWFYTWASNAMIYYFSRAYGYTTYTSIGTSTTLEVKPTLYLSEDISLTGRGTQSNPYKIVS